MQPRKKVARKMQVFFCGDWVGTIEKVIWQNKVQCKVRISRPIRKERGRIATLVKKHYTFGPPPQPIAPRTRAIYQAILCGDVQAMFSALC